jgi:D-alanyl-lipoteichoic acid acyltransferase DltB (MBOAT superfamily)
LLQILLPLAISFHTFQQIAYLVDTYRGETHHYRFLDYLFFVVFFPQLIAGPIVRHDEIIPQIAQRRTWRPGAVELALGVTIFSFGLFKKVVLADYVAVPADLVFAAAGDRLGFFEAWLGATAYALQIYFDFSAYSDMAVGLALLAGIRLPLNFFSPYQAGSIIEFWRRWHMTLSRFLLHYVYVPLGGNRLGRGRRYANLMTTMLLGGLWHGAAWTFVLWGGLHGAYLAINHAWRGTRLASVWAQRRAWRVASVALTFLAVCVAWVFFRAPGFGAALEMLQAMAGMNGLRPTVSHLPDTRQHALLVLGGLLVVFLLPNIYALMERFRPVLADVSALGSSAPAWVRWRPAGAWAMASAIAFCMAALLISKESPFLYFQF